MYAIYYMDPHLNTINLYTPVIDPYQSTIHTDPSWECHSILIWWLYTHPSEKWWSSFDWGMMTETQYNYGKIKNGNHSPPTSLYKVQEMCMAKISQQEPHHGCRAWASVMALSNFFGRLSTHPLWRKSSRSWGQGEDLNEDGGDFRGRQKESPALKENIVWMNRIKNQRYNWVSPCITYIFFHRSLHLLALVSIFFKASEVLYRMGPPKIAKLPYKWLYGRYNYSYWELQ